MGTEKLDVDHSRGARFLSQLIVSAKKCGKTIELQDTRRSTGHDKDAREGVMADVKNLFASLARSVGGAAKKESAQKFCWRHRGQGQTMAEWVNVFDNAVLDMNIAGSLWSCQTLVGISSR